MAETDRTYIRLPDTGMDSFAGLFSSETMSIKDSRKTLESSHVSRQPVRHRRIFTCIQAMPPNGDVHRCAVINVRHVTNLVDALGF